MKPTDILNEENKCIQDEPPFCSAVCPVHVDVRGMMKYLQRGSFEQAAQVFRTKGAVCRESSAVYAMHPARRPARE